MMRTYLGIILAALLSPAAFAQPAANRPRFDVADVHVSPRGDWVKKPTNYVKGGFLAGDRYELGRVTMLDLIKTAYSIEPDKVYGGPSWLDYDRFEVIAKASPETRPEALNLMLQSLLEDRFKLVVKMDTRPMPAYVLSAGKDKPKLKAAAVSDSGGCQNGRGTEPGTSSLQCRGVTMEAFAAALRQRVDLASRNLPVVDSTGLKGAWDFDLQYGNRVTPVSTGIATQQGATLTEAVEKQLGLKLELSKSPQQVLVLEGVNEQPSANPPGVAAALPPLRPPEFEVASIRPCDRTGLTIYPRVEPGGKVTMTCAPLLTILIRALNVNARALDGNGLPKEIAGLPKWVDASETKDTFSMEAKAPAGAIPNGATSQQTQDILNAMLRALLIDRYKLAYHYEDRPMEAYTLVAANPKLTKADPSNRTGCARIPATAGKPGLACQNISMAQFAEQVAGYDGDILYPVLDGTGLQGAWDFTFHYNPLANALMAQLGALGDASRARNDVAGPAAPGESAEPTGSLTFVEALEKQLGLKLEKHTRPGRVLAIDHLEEKPTEN